VTDGIGQHFKGLLLRIKIHVYHRFEGLGFMMTGNFPLPGSAAAFRAPIPGRSPPAPFRSPRSWTPATPALPLPTAFPRGFGTGFFTAAPIGSKGKGRQAAEIQVFPPG
jgi:hypothetical protein